MPCSWQSSLRAILLEQWIMGAAHKHLQQPWPHTAETFLSLPQASSEYISVPECMGLSELQLPASAAQVVMSNPTETQRQHLQEHQSWWLSFSESKRDHSKSFLPTNEAQVKDVQYRYSSVRSKLT